MELDLTTERPGPAGSGIFEESEHCCWEQLTGAAANLQQFRSGLSSPSLCLLLTEPTRTNWQEKNCRLQSPGLHITKLILKGGYGIKRNY